MTSGRGKDGHYGANRVRKALLHFLLGRAGSALISVASLILLLRQLSVTDYGTYVTMLAAQAVVFMFSSAGLDGAMDRFLPELRVSTDARTLRRVVLYALAVRLLLLLLLAVVAALAASAVARTFDFPLESPLLALFVALLLIAGLQQLLTNALEVFLLQLWSQIAQLTYSAVKLGLLAMLSWRLDLRVTHALVVELVAYGVALLIAAAALYRYLRRDTAIEPSRGTALDKTLLRRVARFACLNYPAQLMLQAQGPHGLRVAVSAALGVTAAAQFGFVMGVVDLVRRYLPTTLLLRMIRPIFVSRYTINRNFEQLNQYCRILLNVNAILVAAAVAVTLFYGSQVITAMAGPKYADSRWLLVTAALLLVTTSHMAVVSLLANTMEKNGLQFLGGAFTVGGLLLGLVLSRSLGSQGIIAGTFAGAVAYNLFAVHYLRRHGFDYRPALAPIMRIFAAALTTFGVSALLELWLRGPLGAGLSVAAGVVLYLLSLRIVKPLDAAQKLLLGEVLPQRLKAGLRWL